MKKEAYRYIGFIVTVIVLVVLVLLTKTTCATKNESPMEPTPEVTATEVPTNEPTPTPTNAPTATPTPTPAPTPTEKPEVTAEPTITVCEVSEEASNIEEYEEFIVENVTEVPTATPVESEKEPEKKKKIKSSSLSEVLQRGYCLYEVRESYGTYMLEPEYQAYLYDMCVKYGVEKYYKLMMAVMWHESNFNVKEISKTNDYGLMQINKCNHGWLKKTLDLPSTDFLNPYTSMECGVYMMSSYLIKYDDVHKALVAYNRGDNAVDKQGMTESSYSRTVVDILVNKIFKIEGSEDYDDVVVTAEPTPTEEVIPTEEPTPTEEVAPTDVEEETSEEESEEDGVTSLEDIPSLEEMGEEL